MTPHQVLVIDDDQWFADVLTQQLQAAELVPAYASDAVDGMVQINTAPPAVIVLDMFMPGANGLVLLHELQSYSDLQRIPVIVCSGHIDTLTIDDLYPYGVVALLDKTTMRPVDVVYHVRRALGIADSRSNITGHIV